MANIELVIKIPKRVYNYIRKYAHIANSDILDVKDAIVNSTPLPKGHGALKDADEIKKNQFTLGTSNYCEYKVVKIEDIDKADIIIEADQQESEG